jgi:hypothetical protein
MKQTLSTEETWIEVFITLTNKLSRKQKTTCEEKLNLSISLLMLFYLFVMPDILLIVRFICYHEPQRLRFHFEP